MLIDFKPGFCRIPATGGSRDLMGKTIEEQAVTSKKVG